MWKVLPVETNAQSIIINEALMSLLLLQLLQLIIVMKIIMVLFLYLIALQSNKFKKIIEL